MNIELGSFITVLLVLTVDIGARIAALGIIPNNRKPSEATAWLVIIFFVPLLGWIIFLFLGHSKLSKKRRLKQQSINDLIYQKARKAYAIQTENNPPDWLLSIVRLNSKLGALPLVGGNDILLMQNYNETLNSMAKSIDSAKKYVHIEFYIMSKDSTSSAIFESLARAKQRGVQVRVLFDHVGSLQYPGYKNMLEFLDTHEINYHKMLPILPLKGKFQRPDLRNHRKILVVDGRIGFMGSQNIIDSSYNKKKNLKRGLHWHELMVSVKGPVVKELDAVFVGDWYAESDELLDSYITSEDIQYIDLGDYDCQLVPSGPGFEKENNLRFFSSLLYTAQKRVIITSPYFVPDETMLTAVTTAAERGVRVELYVSEVGDQLPVYHAQRSYYEALLKSGVRIFMYKPPTVLHAKHLTIDDDLAVVGSSNMDMRSFNLNMEISLLIYSHDFVHKMRRIEAEYKQNCRELKLDVWLKRSKREKFYDNVARLSSALQ
jgi:cardiolipin synthase A/B